MHLLAGGKFDGLLWDCSYSCKKEWIHNKVEDSWIHSSLIAIICLQIGNNLEQSTESGLLFLYFGLLKIVNWTMLHQTEYFLDNKSIKL